MKKHNIFNLINRPSTNTKRVVVTRTATIIKVASAYNASIPPKAHAIGGHFNRELSEWVFPASKEIQVQQLFSSTFGVWDTKLWNDIHG